MVGPTYPLLAPRYFNPDLHPLHHDCDGELLGLRALENTVGRRGIMKIAAHRQLHVALAGDAIVGRIEGPPTTTGKVDLDPGVALAGTNQALEEAGLFRLRGTALALGL